MTILFKCMAGELARALNLCSQVSGREKQVPILKATRIVVDDGAATFSATNLDHCVMASIAAEGTGTVYVETALLEQKARVLRQNEPVTVASDEDAKNVIVTQGRTRWKVPILDGTGFPDSFLRASAKADPIKVGRNEFFAALGVAREAIRPSLASVLDQGALLDMADGFRIIATDRHRFASVKPDITGTLAVSVILPNDAMQVAASLFRNADQLEIFAEPNSMQIEADGVFYKTKLIEGQYLDWRKAVEHQSAVLDASVTVDRIAFLEALARATAIAENKTKEGGVIGVRLTFDGSECAMQCKNRNGEEGQDYCEALGDGPSGTVGISAENLRSMVGTFSSDRLVIRFSSTSPEAPAFLTVPDGNPDEFRFVMPMRV